MPPRRPANHRLRAREHLAESAALASESRDAAAADRLLRAAAHALEEIATMRGHLAEDRMELVAWLADEGALPLDACARLNDVWARRDACSEALTNALDAALETVQGLVDVAAGLPAGAGPSFGDDAAEPAWLPGRTTPWLEAARVARRRRLARHAAVLLSALLLLGGAAVASLNGDAPSSAEKTEVGIFTAGS
jgi:hypothetical protein